MELRTVAPTRLTAILINGDEGVAAQETLRAPPGAMGMQRRAYGGELCRVRARRRAGPRRRAMGDAVTK
jgi:hypothetical protein